MTRRLGSMTSEPAKLTKQDTHGWDMWEKLAKNRPTFGNPHVFNSSIPESFWDSFTITLRDTEFFDRMESVSGNEASTGNPLDLRAFKVSLPLRSN
jgi:oleate hydratase